MDQTTESRSPPRRFATLIGVTLALGVPLALFPTGLIARFLPQAGEGSWERDAFMWGLTALVLFVLVVGEGLPLSAIGLKGLRVSSFVWGSIGAAAAVLTWPLGSKLMQLAGGSATDIQATQQQIVSLPGPGILLILLRAAVTEEILFRGYGIERLTALTGSRAIGIVVPALIFALAHAQVWGVAYVLAVLPISIVLTVLYVWRRDLVANMIAHFLTDAIGIAMIFAMAHHMIPQPTGN